MKSYALTFLEFDSGCVVLKVHNMEQSTIELLTEYNIDPQNTAVKQYYDADNLWKTLRIERDENKHSAFLAWLFGHDVNSENSPLIKLLNLLVRRSSDEQMDSQLKLAILKAQLKIKSATTTNEMAISRLSTLASNDRLDIYIKCDVKGVEKFSQLEIIIENKVDAVEGLPKTKKEKAEDWEKDRYQTQRYYYACHENRKDDTTLQLFVFLTGKAQKPMDEQHFITINYQDLVDYILEPYMKNSNIDKHTEMAIKEYLRILGNPYYKTILATTMEEKELLKDFYYRNKDLFMRAVDVMIATTTDEEEMAGLVKLKDAINISRNRRYTINGNGNYSMYQVIEEFARYVMETDKTIDDVDKLVKSYTGSRREFLSDDKDKVKRIKKGKEEYFTFNYNNVDYYGTKEWSGDEDGNFQKLMNGINKNYDDFQIEKIM